MTRRPRLSLRPSTLSGRLAMLTALAVFLAVTASGTGAFAVTIKVLRDQVDASLIGGRRALAPSPRGDPALLCDSLTSVEPALPGSYLVEVLNPDGTTCTVAPSAAVVITPHDRQVAQGTAPDGIRDGRSARGARLRVRITGLGHGYALLVARDVSGVEEVLGRLRVLLFLLSVVGALGALGAGLAVARAGLRPVHRLTGAVERITRTQDLSLDLPPQRRPDEVSRLAVAFNQMVTALSAARARQAALVADAGHELRTPLTSLRTNIDLLMRSERSGRALPAADRAAVLAGVTAQLQELSELVAELVVLTDDEPAPAHLPLRLDDVVRAAVERVRHRAGDRRIEVEHEPWTLLGDAVALERAVVNVLDNAVKFSPPATTISVRQRAGVLMIADEGPGLPAEQRDHAFERFWRADDARGLPGSGLGLAIVADAMTAHGGTARMASTPTGGALVVLTVPGSAVPGSDPRPGG